MTTREKTMEKAAEEVPQWVADAVAEALSNALENGYDFKGWTDEDIADDMMSFNATLENANRKHVILAIHGTRS